ncbi:MAG: preprotein translocase subunit YajC [Candidatus Sumerlaeaceae bacterium]
MELNDLFTNTATLIAQNGGGPAPTPGGGLMQMLPMLALVGLAFYFMILRPQKRDQQKIQDMRGAIKKGDRVKSIGGIYGTVASVDTSRNVITVLVDKNVKLDFDRDAIATVIRKEDAASDADSKVETAVAASK